MKRDHASFITAVFRKKWKIKVDDLACSHVSKKITIPTLVIHDSEDGDVPVSYANNIRQNLKNGSILITKGLGHTKILRDATIVTRVVNYIIKNP
ncbi:MAG: hypothetical protein GKR88_07320 [Flavobacteriaceae bacterium]|nr:MAG: hypothetical protein GKR88_07320 [Flavobacteriaceae bacterium]